MDITLLKTFLEVAATGSFVSANGLIITNHHCVFGILQHHSTPASDLITDGFIAPSRGDEIGGAGTPPETKWVKRTATRRLVLEDQSVFRPRGHP